jgi:hypothetical protein
MVDLAEIWVPFSENFVKTLEGKNAFPAVTVTSASPGLVLCVIEKSRTGFKILAVGDGELAFDWVAEVQLE